VITSAGFEDLDKEEIIKIIRLGNENKKKKEKQSKSGAGTRERMQRWM